MTVAKTIYLPTLKCYIDGGYILFNCEVLIDILYLDFGFLNMRVNLFFILSYVGVYFKADLSTEMQNCDTTKNPALLETCTLDTRVEGSQGRWRHLILCYGRV